MAPMLRDLNRHHVRGGLRDTSVNVKRSIEAFGVVLDVAKEKLARQKSQQIRMKSSRLEGYVVDAGVTNEEEGRDGRQQNWLC